MTAQNKCDERLVSCTGKFKGLWRLLLACFVFAAGAYGYTYLATSALAVSDSTHIKEHVIIASKMVTKDDLAAMEGRMQNYINTALIKNNGRIVSIRATEDRRELARIRRAYNAVRQYETSVRQYEESIKKMEKLKLSTPQPCETEVQKKSLKPFAYTGEEG